MNRIFIAISFLLFLVVGCAKHHCCDCNHCHHGECVHKFHCECEKCKIKDF